MFHLKPQLKEQVQEYSRRYHLPFSQVKRDPWFQHRIMAKVAHPVDLERLYHGVNGFTMDPNDRVNREDRTHVFTTYGEILPVSVGELIRGLDVNRDDVFYDLGSGTGKVCTQFMLDSDARKSAGIEISDTRVREANIIKQKLEEANPYLFYGRELTHLNQNVVECDLSDATIIYTCSTCFSPDFLEIISQKIRQTPNVRAVISLKQLPGMDGFKMRTMPIECTWAKSTAYVYTKN